MERVNTLRYFLYNISRTAIVGGFNASESRKRYDEVFQLLEQHHKWFSGCIPLIASENVPSPAVREAIIADFGNRYAEGWPGERVYAGCVYIDQVELICIELMKKLYDAGLKSLEGLKRAPLENLTNLPLIGPKLAKKIKEQVGGFVKSEEWKRLKKGEAWEQRAITEYKG